MIEETVQVVLESGPFAWVEAPRRGACGHCAASGSCGTSALGNWFSRRPVQLQVRNPIGAKAGDSVVIGIDAAQLMRGTTLIYLVPILTLLAAALLGGELARQLVWGEWLAAVTGILGLLAGLGWARARLALSRRPDLQPTILRQA